MAKILGIKSVLNLFKSMSLKANAVSIVVGYTQNYALVVHENLKARHGKRYNDAYIHQEEVTVTKGKNKGKKKTILSWTALAVKMGYHKDPETKKKKKPRTRGVNQVAKYLEIPARKLKPEFRRIVRQAVKKGATLEQALTMCGLRLQRESQKIVPVDTGLLRASAFTKKE